MDDNDDDDNWLKPIAHSRDFNVIICDFTQLDRRIVNNRRYSATTYNYDSVTTIPRVVHAFMIAAAHLVIVLSSCLCAKLLIFSQFLIYLITLLSYKPQIKSAI